MDSVLGVDVGTTSAKAVVFDAHGRELGGAEQGYRLAEPAPGRAELDPGEVLDATLGVIREAAEAARAGGATVAGLSVSTAMHALLALGDGDRPLTRLVTWADTRAAAEAERLRAEHPELHDRTGTPLHPMSPLPKLLWFAAREPEVFAAARRWVGVKELVLEALTGRWVVDHSVASGTGLLDLQALDWDAEALALAGVDRAQLAELVPATEVLSLSGAAASRAGLEAGAPVVAGAGDGPLANLGVGAVRPGVAACSIGTSGALRVVISRPAVDPARRVFCYALTPGRWVVGGSVNNGGVVLRWAGEALAPDLGEDPQARLVELAGQAPPGSDGLVMLPYLLAERAPHWSTLPRGAYVGLTASHRREHLVRAALEGVCQQLALVLASVREAGNEVAEVRATGGFARSELWRQILADALGMPIGFPEGHEGTAFGAALLGMEALGVVDSIEHADALVRIGDVVEPDPDGAAVLAEMLPTFASLYEALEPAFRALARSRVRLADGLAALGRLRLGRWARVVALDRAVDVRAQVGELGHLLRLDLVARARQVDLEDLLDDGRARREDHDAVGHVDGLVDVVGDEQDGHAVLVADAQDEVLEVGARLRVDGGERLVHEQDLGLVGEAARDRHALLHAARELPRVLVDRAGQADGLDGLVDLLAALLLAHLLAPQREGDVLADLHPRIQRAAVVLEDERHPLGRLGHRLAAQLDGARGRREQPRDGLQQRRLAAPRRADDAQELALGDLEAEVLDRLGLVVPGPVGLAEVGHFEHLGPLGVVTRRRRARRGARPACGAR